MVVSKIKRMIRGPIYAVLPWLDRFQQFWARWLYRLLNRFGIWERYQPAPWADCPNALRAKATEDRWAVIRQELTGLPAGTAVDIGSQIGYFAFRLAELGYLVLGLESNPNSLRAARLIRWASGLEGAELEDDWKSRDAILRQYRAIFAGSRLLGEDGLMKHWRFKGASRLRGLVRRGCSLFTGAPVPGWYDTHARHQDHSPSTATNGALK